MKRGDLTEAEMDRMAMSTGEDLANPGDFEMQASLSGFNPGNIISDHVFYDGSSMSLSQIKSFLNSKVSSCRSGYTCLPDYTQNTKSRSADQYCDGYTGRSGESAAAIIYRVAKSCDINPKALIVILQKEQGLVTHTWPSDWRYTIAMGMACPDTSACDTRYYGFQNQVYSAARQYQVYSKSSYFSWYPVGATSNVRWHPNASCGSAPVYIENKATAALYYYTPYQPNEAALKAGDGTGDSCCRVRQPQLLQLLHRLVRFDARRRVHCAVGHPDGFESVRSDRIESECTHRTEHGLFEGDNLTFEGRYRAGRTRD